MKICSGENSCGLLKSLNEFYFRKDSGKYRDLCKKCISFKFKIYYESNKDNRKKYQRKYSLTNKLVKKQTDKKYKEKNKEELKKKNKNYYIKNKEIIKYKRNQHNKKRLKNDPSFKLRCNISKIVNKMLKLNGSSKAGQSILKYLPYSIKNLKSSIEAKFSHPNNLDNNGKIWMTWERWGKQREDFDKNNPDTWMFNIDHIIPQSKLPYDSMTHHNFKKCWDIENLQPMRSDLNLSKGNKETYEKNNQLFSI